MDHLTDEELMQHVVQEDLDMMRYLFQRYQVKIYNYVLLITRDKDISKDLTQDVFYKVIKYRQTYQQKQFSSWIYTIARNSCNDHYKTAKRRQRLSEQQLKLASPEDDSSTECFNQVKQLNKALNQLKRSDKELIIMSRYQGMKYREIAAVTNSTVGAVKTKVHRAMHKLKDCYLAKIKEK